MTGRRLAPLRATRVLLLALGLAALGFGLAGLFGQPRPTNPPNSLLWLVGGLLVHDVVVAPAAVAVGFALSRLVPPPYRSLVQGGLVVSAAAAAASLPLWLGYGGAPGNQTVNALPYGRNLLAVLGVVWFVVALLMLARWRRARRDARSAGRPPATSAPPSGPR